MSNSDKKATADGPPPPPPRIPGLGLPETKIGFFGRNPDAPPGLLRRTLHRLGLRTGSV